MKKQVIHFFFFSEFYIFFVAFGLGSLSSLLTVGDIDLSVQLLIGSSGFFFILWNVI